MESTPSELINEQFKIWELQGYMVFLKGMINILKMILTLCLCLCICRCTHAWACTSHMGVEEGCQITEASPFFLLCPEDQTYIVRVDSKHHTYGRLTGL